MLRDVTNFTFTAFSHFNKVLCNQFLAFTAFVSFLLLSASICTFLSCRFTTYRHRFALAAPAPRAKRNDDSKIQRIVDVRRPSIFIMLKFDQNSLVDKLLSIS